MNTYTEGELSFDFPDGLSVKKMDKQGIPIPMGMKLVDFVLRGNSDTYLLEIKDPSHSEAPDKNRADYKNRIKTKDLIAKELVPKARDSYTCLHLMEEDDKPFTYLVLLALDAWAGKDQKAMLLGFKDRLAKRLNQETDQPWERKYIKDCAVLTVEKWNSRFPDWKVDRISS